MAQSNQFNCRAGECTKCCSYEGLEDFKIPVTFGDLIRAYILEKSNGSGKSFSQVFDDRCDGWMAFPANSFPYVLPVPTSRNPCYNFDKDRKMCKVYGKAQFVTCGAYPEECLLTSLPKISESTTIDISERSTKSKDYSESLPCLKDAKLSPEQEKRTIEIAVLRGKEIHAIGMTFNHPQNPILVNANSLDRAELRLQQMIKLADKREYLKRIWINVHRTQKMYMELFGVGNPDYTRSPFKK